MTQKRELFRVAIDRICQIRRGAEPAPCKVLDLTEKGFQLQVEEPVEVGDELQLEFNLSEGCPVLCTVLVTHVHPPNIGVRIIRISPEQQTQLSRFIDQLNQLNMIGY
jgi:hypothetical protein